MGNFLESLNKQINPINAPPLKPKENCLLKNSLSKLREYHGTFKSTCETFSIDKQEFNTIFNTPDKLKQHNKNFSETEQNP